MNVLHLSFKVLSKPQNWAQKNAESVLLLTVIVPKLWNFNSAKDNADNLTNIISLTLILHVLSEYYSALMLISLHIL